MSESKPGRWVRIIAWAVAGLFLVTRLPVFLALVIAPDPGIAGSALGALVGAALLRYLILKSGTYISNLFGERNPHT